MIQKVLVLLLVTIVLKTSFLAEAQQQTKAPRLGFWLAISIPLPA